MKKDYEEKLASINGKESSDLKLIATMKAQY